MFKRWKECNGGVQNNNIFIYAFVRVLGGLQQEQNVTGLVNR